MSTGGVSVVPLPPFNGVSSPLTKEQAAIDNGGGGNWGANVGGDINQTSIKRLPPPTPSIFCSCCETKTNQ